MTNIILTGCNGRMGRAIAGIASQNPNFNIAAGVDIMQAAGQTYAPYPVFASINDTAGVAADVIVDFSHHTAVEGILAFARSSRLPAVIATTGHTGEELEMIRKASQTIPVFRSGNMSLGISLLTELVKKAAAALGEGFDVEIVERHHNKKLDAPSGTALMLAEALSQTLPYEPDYVYDRHVRHQARSPREIGIHSIRGGTIVGEHEVVFAGPDEVVTLSHSALSRDVFAHGALRAAAFLIGKPAGQYDMRDIVNELEI